MATKKPMFVRDWEEGVEGTTYLNPDGSVYGYEPGTSNTGTLYDSFGQGTNDPLEQFGANNVVGAEQFGGNAILGQVAGQFGDNLNPVNDPIFGTAGYVNYPIGGAAYTPEGHQILAHNMTNQLNQAMAEQAYLAWVAQQNKDRLNLQLELARIAAESRKYAMDKWAEAWGGGGDVDFDMPEGFRNVRGQQWATTEGDYQTDIPRMQPNIEAIARSDVDQAVMPDMGGGDQLNEIFAQGRGAGLDVARGKLGEEIGKKQAELIASQQGAEAQQGVANSRWIQDLRDAISKVQGKAQQQGLSELALKSQTFPLEDLGDTGSGLRGYQRMLTG